MSAVLLAFLVVCRVSLAQKHDEPPDTSPYRRAALEVASWLEACTTKTPEGTTWPVVPGSPSARESSNLYQGSAGVVLFFLESYRATGEKRYLELARSGAKHLLAKLPEKLGPAGASLYTGVAGTLFVLLETYELSSEARWRDGARACVRLLRKRARKAGGGIEWNDTSDIIRGGAGIGLALLHAATALQDDEECLALAEAAGRRLVELGRPAKQGKQWPMNPRYPRMMPNFSHGTAGVCYFLATLYQTSKKRLFLDAALDGARYLVSVAGSREDSGKDCLVFHHEPGGEELFYLGWCHGPPGTARLFYRLWKISGEDKWLDFVKRSAAAVLQSGIPEKRTPGFWNNVGVCCGSAGVADWFLELHRITADDEYLRFARRLTDDLLARASKDETGLSWVQAEHRVRPKLLEAQTGYMQGAAGIGLWLWKLAAYEEGRPMRLRLPDSPYPALTRR
ncbi:MAG: lanthionine synthetase LanC family protein [Planctomycetota bacterium]